MKIKNVPLREYEHEIPGTNAVANLYIEWELSVRVPIYWLFYRGLKRGYVIATLCSCSQHNMYCV
jgi:hypothetical protein